MGVLVELVEAAQQVGPLDQLVERASRCRASSLRRRSKRSRSMPGGSVIARTWKLAVVRVGLHGERLVGRAEEAGARALRSARSGMATAVGRPGTSGISFFTTADQLGYLMRRAGRIAAAEHEHAGRVVVGNVMVDAAQDRTAGGSAAPAAASTRRRCSRAGRSGSGLNSPRMSAGASGFMSHMSWCGGPPCCQMKMTFLALALAARGLLARPAARPAASGPTGRRRRGAGRRGG